MANVLLTYFEPFGGSDFNASSVINELDLQGFSFSVGTVQLPVCFSSAWPTLEKNLGEHSDVEIILAFGEAGDRNAIHLERMAINWMESRQPDNDGLQPEGKRILPLGPDGLMSSLDVSGLSKKSTSRSGMKICVSNTAGTFVCNHLMYNLLNWTRAHRLKGGFVHLPALRPSSPGFSTDWSQLKESLGFLLANIHTALLN